MPDEIPLIGPYDQSGSVVRIGDTVRRPPRDSSGAVRALLLHLEDCGFEGAPRFLDVDERGRDVLTFLEGDVPQPPYPGWAMTDAALASMGDLLRRLHAATANFDASAVAGWEPEWADPTGGPVICHNDTFPENVVFRDDRAVALIDFDVAGPGRPFWDLAIAAQEWVPLHAPETRRDHDAGLDAVARFGLLARSYGIEPAGAEELVAVMLEERAHSVANIRAHVAAGEPVWLEHWAQAGKEADEAIDVAWLGRERAALVAAAGCGSSR